MALARLRPEQREVVELKCYGGLTLAEIADAAKADARTSWERYHQLLRDLATTTATFKL
jgi:DNA-directed RNA polymerase specialized sigma24 family protein